MRSQKRVEASRWLMNRLVRPPGHLVVLLVEIILGDGVKGGSGLIQHKNRRVFIQGTGQHQALSLAAGELHAVQIDIPAHMGLDTRRRDVIFSVSPAWSRRTASFSSSMPSMAWATFSATVQESTLKS